MNDAAILIQKKSRIKRLIFLIRYLRMFLEVPHKYFSILGRAVFQQDLFLLGLDTNVGHARNALNYDATSGLFRER